MRRTALLLSIIAIPLLASCGGAGGSDVGTNPPPPTNTGGNNTSTSNSISVGNDFYSPSATTVKVGTSVTWTWNSSGVDHSVTLDDGSADSGVKSSGTFSHTFSTAGTYKYHCKVHGSAMSGTITVQ